MDALEFVNILVQDKHNMIETIFQAREEDIAELNKSDINIMDKEKLEERHKKLIEAVNTISTESEKDKNNILDLFEKYSDSVDVVNAYFNKKYYKKRIKRWNKINNRIIYIRLDLLQQHKTLSS